MRTKLIALTLCSAALFSFSPPTSAREVCPTDSTFTTIQPRYVNIQATSFVITKSKVYADLDAWKSTSLSINLRIYQGSKLIDTFKASGSGTSLVIDEPYHLNSGTYRVVCTFKAGSDSDTREQTYYL